MRILLVGVGRWGRNHLKSWTKLAEEIYVADADPGQSRICAEFSIPPSRFSLDYRDFLDRVDGVDVVTPAESHLAICRDSLERDKDVFVEKPIALTTKEAGEMIALAEKKGRILQVGHIYRYHPASTRIKALLEEGTLGPIRYAYGHFMGFKRPRTDVGVTQTDAIHFVDLFNFLFGERPSAVTAVVRHYLDLPLDDTSFSALEYGKKTAFIEAGYLPPEKRRDISIVGERASLYCDLQKGVLLRCDNRHEWEGGRCVAVEGKATEVEVPRDEPLKRELEAFLDAIRSRKKPLSDGQAGYEALRVVEACYESSRRGERVELQW